MASWVWDGNADGNLSNPLNYSAQSGLPVAGDTITDAGANNPPSSGASAGIWTISTVTIAGGMFNGNVTINGVGISGGSFNSSVVNNDGTVTGGTFNGSFTNENGGTVSGATFNGTFYDNSPPNTNNVFNGDVYVNGVQTKYSSFTFNTLLVP
jgi:hypothetical protein